MKLPELKKRFKNKYVIRIAAGVLTVAVAGGSLGTCTVQAEKASKAKTETTQEAKDAKEDAEEVLEEVLTSKVSLSDEIDKEETVYIVADNTGKADTVIVSDWLKNPDKKDSLEDASDLKDIKNVKGKEKFKEKDGKITWAAKGNDIYYQGTTNKKLPVEQTITYYLDGKKMDPEKIAGKSGKVTIRFDYKNNEKTTTTVDGKKYNVYVPFTILTGMVLDDSYSNVEVKNGKVVSDGDSQFVAGIAMPGLKESLKAKSSDFAGDVEIPEYIEVTADVEDFKLDMTMSVMLSGITTGSDIDDLVDLGDLDSAIDTLSDSSTQLADGTKELRSGLEQLRSNLPALSAGVNALNSSTGTLRDGIAQLDQTLNTPMSNEAKEAAAKQAADTVADQADTIAKQAADTVADQADTIAKQAEEAVVSPSQKAAIEKQAEDIVAAKFADDRNPEGTKNLTAYAAQTFYNQLTSEESVAKVKTSLAANASLVDSIKVSLREQVAGAVGEQNISTTMTALNTTERSAAITYIYDNTPAVQQGVAAALKLGQVVPQYANLETKVVDIKLNEMATSVLAGVAENAKGSVGASVAQAAKEGATKAAREAAVTGAQQGAAQGAVAGATQAAQQAAVTGAQQGAAQGAVAGAEAAKAEVAAGIETKTASGYSLVSGMEALKNGTQALVNQIPVLADGVNKLADGSKTLNEGMIKFDEEGIQKLADTYNGDVKSLMERVAAVMKAGSEYQSFSDKADETVGEVKFIIRTEGVKAKED